MKIIGITGGVGSGKSEVLNYIKSKYNCKVILADKVAHTVKERGQKCYDGLVSLLGEEVLSSDLEIDKKKMSEKIFSDKEVLQKVNDMIHPAVKRYIQTAIKKEETEKKVDFLLIEAALLIEAGYENIVDELWYVYAPEEVRRERLKRTRLYSDEKITSILSRQLSEEEFKSHCSACIDNGKTLQHTYEQIDKKLEEYLWLK